MVQAAFDPVISHISCRTATGEYLFSDPDWCRMYERVTLRDAPLFTPAQERALHALPAVRDLLCSVLVRDAAARPRIPDIAAR